MGSSMQFAIGVLTHTPFWVFPLFAFLIWQGTLAFRPRTQPIRRLLTVPTIFFIMGVSRIVLRQEGQWPVICWLVGAVLFAVLGFFTGPRIVSIDKAKGLVTRAGSKIPLIRNIVVFALQYGFAVASAVHASDRQT